MQVRATATGYYDDVIRNKGDVFTLKPRKRVKRTKGGIIEETVSVEEQFTALWMERVVQPLDDRTRSNRSNQLGRGADRKGLR
jgi:hypothetical protein